MSQPFAQLVARRAEQFCDSELTEEAFKRLARWSMMSGAKLVSLDDVAWIGALILKGCKSAGIDCGLAKSETRDENGSRVVGVVASDGVRVADGAG